MSYPSAPGLDNDWDGWLPHEAYELGVRKALTEVRKSLRILRVDQHGGILPYETAMQVLTEVEQEMT